MQLSDKRKITVGARSSPLSVAQVREVELELSKHAQDFELELLPIATIGDRDQKTSLRSMEKTDFFTRDIDIALLEGKCRIAVHSAKDLPNPLPKGIAIAAVTKGVDSSDSLVLRAGETLEGLREGAVIATSSERREEAVKMLRKDLSFRDVRGTIHQRLALLDNGEADGVVIAEAALIRLGLTHLNRITLPGATVDLQGRLAIAARVNDNEMMQLFQKIDSRPIQLHIGLTAPKEQPVEYTIRHIPFITTVPRQIDTEVFDIQISTHVIFTSKMAVKYTIDLWGADVLRDKLIIAVGTATANALEKHQLRALIASESTSEGICGLLETLSLDSAHVFWPHSAQSRPVITEYLDSKQIKWTNCPIYDTITSLPSPLPPLDQVKCVHFTSPSCVDAFFQAYEDVPEHVEFATIGPVTAQQLNRTYFKSSI